MRRVIQFSGVGNREYEIFACLQILQCSLSMLLNHGSMGDVVGFAQTIERIEILLLWQFLRISLLALLAPILEGQFANRQLFVGLWE